MSSHEKGKMLLILSDFIMNYEFVCALGLAILAFSLVSFFSLGLPTMGFWSSLLIGSIGCQHFLYAYTSCFALAFGLTVCAKLNDTVTQCAHGQLFILHSTDDHCL